MGSRLDPATEALVRVSAAIAAGARERIERALEAARAHVDTRAVEEAILQSYLFLGYPAALNTFALWRHVSGEPASEPLDEDPASWPRRGEAVCRAVYAGQYDRLRGTVRALHRDMERWMVEEGYGKVLGRPGLALDLRELCVVAILAGIDAPRQLYSHLRGAIQVGADDSRVDAVLDVALEEAPPHVVRRSREVWQAVRVRRAAGGAV